MGTRGTLMAGRDASVPERETAGRRAYRALLALYPTPFRRRYGDEMLQLLSDQLRDAGRSGARPGTVGTWFRSLGDLWVSAMSERVRGNRGTGHSLGEPPSAAMKALGLVGILGGALLVAAFIPNLPWTADLFNLRLVMFNLGAIAVAAALFRDQLRVSRPLAIAGTVPVVLANVIYLLMILNLVSLPGQPGPGDYGPYWAIGATFMWLADAWFGVVLFRTRVVARWLALMLAMAATISWGGLDRLGLVGGDLAWFFGPLSLAGIAVHGVTWILLGICVARRRRTVVDQRAAGDA